MPGCPLLKNGNALVVGTVQAETLPGNHLELLSKVKQITVLIDRFYREASPQASAEAGGDEMQAEVT